MYGFFYGLSKILTFAALFTCSLKVIGQAQTTIVFKHLDPYEINCSGGSYFVNQLMIDWTTGNMGNTFSYASQPTLILSTGYLQNNYHVTALFKEIEAFGLQIKVGPNPFQNTLQMLCAQDGLDIVSIKIYDSQGVIIKSMTGPFSGLQFDKKIQMQKLSNPICYVQIKYSVASTFILQRTYKLLQYL